MIIPENLEELKPLAQWVNYIRIWNPTKKAGRGGYDKPPINPETLRDGMTNDPRSWTTYEKAAENIGKTATHRDTKHRDPAGNAPTVRAPIEGVGLIMAGGYCGVDLDDVIDDAGNLAPFAAAILDRLDTYAEISPSGRGLHLLLYCGDILQAAKAAEVENYKTAMAAGVPQVDAIRRAKGSADFGKQFTLNSSGEITDEAGKACELEIYFYVRGGRYFTVTGKAYRDKPINHSKGAELRKLYEEYTGKVEKYRAAKLSASTVGTHRTAGRAATGEDDRRMVESALKAIIPGMLNGYKEWGPVMSALREMGFSYSYAEEWSSGRLSGTVNPINNPADNERRWNRGNFRLRDGAANAAGIIINAAKRQGWKAAEAFDADARAEYGRSLYSAEARTAYGRSLHSDEERRQYGRDRHAARLAEWTEKHAEGLREWQARRKNPQKGAEGPQNDDGKRG